ncbi:carbonic anhydrase [Jannaschia sp. Os4]|uniref:carbonic anhydrase n=1 Tax=Jannaschia sp. Os4 TaxID=2807617 RepID=UPI001939EA7B|nr:carbonic anhydrase [Jannaschia sp. Os4]MBM2575417.1 carbonic anhydrase [Jannaschia sp. Os4]
MTEQTKLAARPLPQTLVQRHHGWRATTWEENAGWYRRLADEGQRPRAMIISCCDSRVNVTSIFGAEQGEFFVHRNVANLVPPYEPDGGVHGTSAAVEYAVTALHVPQIVVIGHSRCGGVRGCHDMCAGTAPDLDQDTSFVGRWMDMLRPGYEEVRDIADEEERLAAMERRSVVISLHNLATFPFVAAAVEAGDLSLHGAWTDISSGALESYDPETDRFVPV